MLKLDPLEKIEAIILFSNQSERERINEVLKNLLAHMEQIAKENPYGNSNGRV